LKPEQWGSLLVQENNQEGKACDKRRIIIIIIIWESKVMHGQYIRSRQFISEEDKRNNNNNNNNNRNITDFCAYNFTKIYRAFHNVLRDYEHL
jgi:hypothetical protein